MKRLLFLAVLLFSVFALQACDEKAPPIVAELSAPTNVVIQEGVVSWTAVENATGYRVVVGQNQYETANTTYNLNTLQMAAGNYNVTIVAFNATQVSLPSSSMLFVVSLEVVLEAPENVALNQGVLSYDAVNGATAYVITIGNVSYEITETQFNLANITLPQGSHNVYVKAINLTETSGNSSSVTYTLAADQLSSEFGRVLKMYDEIFEPGMTNEELGEGWFYYYYLSSHHIASSFFLIGQELGLNDNTIVMIYDELIDADYSGSMSLVQMLEIMEVMQAMEVESGVFAAYLTRMMAVMFEAGTYDNMNSFNNVQAQIETMEFFLDEMLNNPQIAYLMDSLETLLSVDDFNVFLYHLNAESDEYYSMGFIFENALWDVYYDNDPSYLVTNPDGLESVVYRYFLALYADDEESFMFMKNNFSSVFYDFNTMVNYARSLKNYHESLDHYGSRIQEALDNAQSIKNNSDAYVDALTLMMDYMWQMSDTLPLTLAISIDELFMDETFSVEEAMVLKEELYSILMLNMPTLNEFEVMNEALVMFVSMQTGLIIENETTFVQELAYGQRLVLQTLISFIHYFDLEDYHTIEESVAVLNDMYDLSDLMDVEVLRAIHNLVNIYHGFKEANLALVEEIEAYELENVLTPIIQWALRARLGDVHVMMPMANPIFYYSEHPEVITDALKVALNIASQLKDGLFAKDSTAIDELEAIYLAMEQSNDPSIEALDLAQWINTYLLSLDISAEEFGNLIAFAWSSTRPSHNIEVHHAFIEALRVLGVLAVDSKAMVRDFIDFMNAEDVNAIIDYLNNRTIEEMYVEQYPVYEYVCDQYDCRDMLVRYEEYTYYEERMNPEANAIFFQYMSIRLSLFFSNHPEHKQAFMDFVGMEETAELWAYMWVVILWNNRYYDVPQSVVDFLFEDASKQLQGLLWLVERSFESLDLLALTEGELFNVILALMESDDETLVIDALTLLIPHVQNMLVNVDENNVLDIASLWRMMMLNNIYRYNDESELLIFIEATDVALAALVPTLLDVRDLVLAFSEYLEDYLLLVDLSDNTTSFDPLSYIVVKALDDFLNETNEAAIIAIINQVFEDVLSLTEVQDMIDIDPTYLPDVKDDVIGMANALFTRIHNISALMDAPYTFETFYLLEQITSEGIFNLGDEIVLVDLGAIESNEGITVENVEFNHYLVTFTPTETNFYELQATESHYEKWNVYIEIEGTYHRVYSYNGNHTNLPPNLEFVADETYYIVFSSIYYLESIHLLIQTFDDTGFTMDNPHVLTDDGLYFMLFGEDTSVYMSYLSNESGQYGFFFTGNQVHINLYLYEWMNGEYVLTEELSGNTQYDAFEVFMNQDTQYIIQIQSWESEVLTINLMPFFSNDADSAIELYLDTWFSLLDVGPYSLIWFSFTPGNANYYEIILSGYGYYMIDIYDQDFDSSDYYSGYVWGATTIYFTVPENGVFIVLTKDNDASFDGLEVKKGNNYVQKETINLYVPIDVVADGNVVEVSFIAPHNGQYLFYIEPSNHWNYDFLVNGNHIKNLWLQSNDIFGGTVLYLTMGDELIVTSWVEEDSGFYLYILDYDEQVDYQATLYQFDELNAFKIEYQDYIAITFTPSATDTYTLFVSYYGPTVYVEWYDGDEYVLAYTSINDYWHKSVVELTAETTYTIYVSSEWYRFDVFNLSIYQGLIT